MAFDAYTVKSFFPDEAGIGSMIRQPAFLQLNQKNGTKIMLFSSNSNN
jgi:hypothetical protein